MPDNSTANAWYLAALGPAFIPHAAASYYKLVNYDNNPVMWATPHGAIYQATNRAGQAGYQLIGSVTSAAAGAAKEGANSFFTGLGASVSPWLIIGGGVVLGLLLRRR